MANGKILRQLIKAGATGDTATFRRVSEAIIDEERQKQHHLLLTIWSIFFTAIVLFRLRARLRFLKHR